MRPHLVGLGLAIGLLASSALRADDRALKAETDALQQTAAALARSMADVTKGSTMGIGPTGTWLIGAYLHRGQTTSIQLPAKKGGRYAMCAAIAGEGRSLTLRVKGADGKVLCEEEGPTPLALVSPESDGPIATRVATDGNGPPALCLVALLKEGGAPVVPDQIEALARTLATRIRLVAGGPRNGSLDHGRAEWCVIGAILDPKGVALAEQLDYGGGIVHGVAVAQAGARDVDLGFTDTNRKTIKADSAKDALPHVEFKTDPALKYGLVVTLPDASARSLVLAAVVREGGAAQPPTVAAKPDPPKLPSTTATLGEAPLVPDRLFGLPEEITVAYGVWRVRRVKDSVCMAPADGSFALEWWEGSNGYVVVQENGSVYNWMAVGARLPGKFDIPPISVSGFGPEKRLAERDGKCRRWSYRFTPEGIELTNTETEAKYIVLKLRAELVHERAGVRTVLPAKQP